MSAKVTNQKKSNNILFLIVYIILLVTILTIKPESAPVMLAFIGTYYGYVIIGSLIGVIVQRNQRNIAN